MSASRKPGGSRPPKHRVVILSKYIPYPGIPHAGGEYLESHLAALEAHADVELVAPATPLNMVAIKLVRCPRDVTIMEKVRPPLRGMFFRFFQLEAIFAGCAIYWPVRHLFRGQMAPWPQLAAASALEFQWSEMISLAPLIRKQLPEQIMIGVAHDINSQRWQREVSQSRSLSRRWVASFIAKRTRRQESEAFSALNVLIVFSEKDAALARALAPQVRVEVLHPGIKPKSELRNPSATEPIVLFVGAMNRPENEKAGIWFLEQVWPAVSRNQPNARFVIAGANPSERLIELALKSPNVEVTGFLDSLAPWYEKATVCVVPLQTGAGVKFKTIDAMLAGVPIITTSVGAEGIDAHELFTAVTDDAVDFASATVKALSNPDLSRAEHGKRWALSEYGQASFVTRLHGIYASVFDD